MACLMKRVLPFCTAILTVSVVSTQLSLSQTQDENVIRAAQDGLQLYLQKIPPGAERRYGFSDRTEFTSAVIGSPMGLCSIHPDSLRDGIKSGKHFLMNLEEWKVPVLVGGDMRAILTIAKVEGKFRVVELSGAGLAQELNLFNKQHPKEKKAFLRLFQAHCDFLILMRGNISAEDGDVYPLGSAKVTFSDQRFEDGKPYSMKHLLPVIRQKYSDEHWFDEKNRGR